MYKSNLFAWCNCCLGQRLMLNKLTLSSSFRLLAGCFNSAVLAQTPLQADWFNLSSLSFSLNCSAWSQTLASCSNLLAFFYSACFMCLCWPTLNYLTSWAQHHCSAVTSLTPNRLSGINSTQLNWLKGTTVSPRTALKQFCSLELGISFNSFCHIGALIHHFDPQLHII